MQRWVEQKEQQGPGQGWSTQAQAVMQVRGGARWKQDMHNGSGHPGKSLDDEEDDENDAGEEEEGERSGCLVVVHNHNDKVSILLLPCWNTHFILAP